MNICTFVAIIFNWYKIHTYKILIKTFIQLIIASMAAITIDFGGTQIKFGIIEKNGDILASGKINSIPDDTIEKSLILVSKNIRELIAENNIPLLSLEGIGIALPSIIDPVKNLVLSRYVKYTDANEFDFSEWSRCEWNLPVVLENDARAALAGEWKHGAGKGFSDIVLLTLGTGVGSAVLINDQLLRGKHFLAGNLAGHISINLNGTPCNCGFAGCLETEASTWALPSLIAREKNAEKSSLSKIEKPEFIHLFEEADKGDELANHLLEHCLKAWGICAVNMVHAFDPSIIIFSGGIMKRKETILPYIQKMVDEYAWLAPGTVTMTAATQVEYAGLLGMAYLVNQLNKTTA